MAMLNIIEPFTITLENGSPREFAAGIQEVPDELASHWYVKVHCAEVPAEESAESVKSSQRKLQQK